MASKKHKTKKENCTTCGQEGHLTNNCWGRCPAYQETGHRPGECILSQNEIIRKENRRKRNLRLKRKRKLKRRIDKPQIAINLPDEEEVSNSNFGEDSLSDEGTVIDTHDTEDSSGDSEEDEASEEVKRVREVIGDLSDKDIISAIEKIRIARETDNSAQGLISNRQAKAERFLFDSGASVLIMGEVMAKENKLTIKKLTKPDPSHISSGNGG